MRIRKRTKQLLKGTCRHVDREFVVKARKCVVTITQILLGIELHKATNGVCAFICVWGEKQPCLKSLNFPPYSNLTRGKHWTPNR